MTRDEKLIAYAFALMEAEDAELFKEMLSVDNLKDSIFKEQCEKIIRMLVQTIVKRSMCRAHTRIENEKRVMFTNKYWSSRIINRINIMRNVLSNPTDLTDSLYRFLEQVDNGYYINVYGDEAIIDAIENLNLSYSISLDSNYINGGYPDFYLVSKYPQKYMSTYMQHPIKTQRGISILSPVMSYWTFVSVSDIVVDLDYEESALPTLLGESTANIPSDDSAGNDSGKTGSLGKSDISSTSQTIPRVLVFAGFGLLIWLLFGRRIKRAISKKKRG